MKICNVGRQSAAMLTAIGLFAGGPRAAQSSAVGIQSLLGNARLDGEATTFPPASWLKNFRKKHRWQRLTLISVTSTPAILSLVSSSEASGNDAPLSTPRLTILVQEDAQTENVTQSESSYSDNTSYAQRKAMESPVPYTLRTARARGEIWVADLDGNRGRKLVARSGFTYASVLWSPDGQWLLYQGREGDGYIGTEPKPMQTWIVDANGKQSREIAEGDDAQPQWSVDSASVTFWHNETNDVPKVKTAGSAPTTYEPARWYLYRAGMPWKKSAVTRASNVALDGAVSLSPDGNRFICKVWQRSGGQYLVGPLAIVNVITGTITALDSSRRTLPMPQPGEPPFESVGYRWSPDGKWAANLNSNFNGGNGLGIINVEADAQNRARNF